jgi:hypothetical protein
MALHGEKEVVWIRDNMLLVFYPTTDCIMSTIKYYNFDTKKPTILCIYLILLSLIDQLVCTTAINAP